MRTSSSGHIELSVIVLGYKSQDYLRIFCLQILEEVKKMGITFEIVLVANYDSDDDITPKIALELQNQYAEVVSVIKKKKGKMGWDMRSGLKKGSGNYVLVIDGDGQMPVSDIPLVYNIIINDEFDMVKTFRAKRFDGLYRTLLSKGYNMLFKLFFRPNFPVIDVNSKPKIIKRAILDKMVLESNDWFTDSEIMLQASLMNLKVCEVSSVFHKNETRKSFINGATIIEFLINLVSYRFKKK
jgi:glycosyltransferase involved in cell wall biosynthesis